MSVAVLIPCYNEGQTIQSVVENCRRFLPDADIYVYDNNSTDDTAAIAAQAGAIVRKEGKQGKGNVIRTMFRDIDADCYLMMDGDGTYPAKHAPELCRLVLEEGMDMVVGDRLSSTYFTENKRPFHNSGNLLVKKLVNTFFGGDVKDIMTGYRAFSPLFVKSFPVLSEGFEIETEMTIHALDKNLHVADVPVDYQDRPQGSESKLNTFSDGFKVLGTIFRLYKNYRPFPFFSLLALLLLALAAVFFLPVLLEYIQTGQVGRYPTLVVSGFVALGAMMAFFAGLILDTEVRHSRQDFEVKLNIIRMMMGRSKKR